MKPPVIAGGKLKGQFVILKIIFSHIDVETVAGKIVEGLAGDFLLLHARLSADISAGDQLLLDLYQILLVEGNIQRGKNRLQMLDLCFDFFGQFR